MNNKEQMPYNLEEAQEEASQLKEKVKSGKAEDYNQAEERVEKNKERLEEIEKDFEEFCNSQEYKESLERIKGQNSFLQELFPGRGDPEHADSIMDPYLDKPELEEDSSWLEDIELNIFFDNYNVSAIFYNLAKDNDKLKDLTKLFLFATKEQKHWHSSAKNDFFINKINELGILKDKKALEIGTYVPQWGDNPQISHFELFGVEIEECNRDLSISDYKSLGGQSFDITYSSFVLEDGSGVEELKGKSHNLLTVFANITKEGGYTAHTGLTIPNEKKFLVRIGIELIGDFRDKGNAYKLFKKVNDKVTSEEELWGIMRDAGIRIER